MTSLALATVAALAHACAPVVSPGALIPLVWAESAFDPLTIGVNGRPHQSFHPASASDAVRQARALLAQGADLDLGLAQLNVHNLPRLGLSIGDAFDPCRNIEAGAHVLTQGYLAARATTASTQAALAKALSRYNSGDDQRGFKNGYVARVYRAATVIVPALSTTMAARVAPAGDNAAVRLGAIIATRLAADPQALDVFATQSSTLVSWTSAPSAAAALPTVAAPSLSSSGDPS